ncbi:unnamed protein product [Clonostachys byssicola]|uniref:Uncharacterized protein n=1 Tax=Clonostachys byssicola TaxID=160290 RepID=A0A9N9Y013_9HYPO|nr:unnamed protein product [Clonostachys byssicola]
MDSITEWSAFSRAQIDDVIQSGLQDSLSDAIDSYLKSITYQYLFQGRSEEFLAGLLCDAWYALIQAGKNITTHEFHQDIIVRDLVAVRALGPMQDSVQSISHTQGVITFSDGYTLWSGLPLLSMTLTEEFTERYYQKDHYSPGQRENMAGLLARLLAAGFYDGPALCALSLFRETLETHRPLVKADIEEASDSVLPLEGLLEALTDLLENSGYSLAILSASTTSNIKTKHADHPRLSGLGELALQHDTITDLSPTGYSPQRWSFWAERLRELKRCGVESIERRANFCLGYMHCIGDQTKLLPEVICQNSSGFREE